MVFYCVGTRRQSARTDDHVLGKLQALFTEHGTCKDWVTESKDLAAFLDSMTDSKLAFLFARCGMLENSSWKACVVNIWTDHEGVDLADVRLRACKILYESVFETWRSRHDVSVFV